MVQIGGFVNFKRKPTVWVGFGKVNTTFLETE